MVVQEKNNIVELTITLNDEHILFKNPLSESSKILTLCKSENVKVVNFDCQALINPISVNTLEAIIQILQAKAREIHKIVLRFNLI